MADENVGQITNITHHFIWMIPQFKDIWTFPNTFFIDSPEFSIEERCTIYFRLMTENADRNYPLMVITKGVLTTELMANINWLSANKEVYNSHTVHCQGSCYLVPDLITVRDIVLFPEELLPGGVLSIEIELMKETASLGASMKFEPPIGIDYTTKNGNRVMVQTRHQCTSEDKSFEELRYECYRLTRSPSVWSIANTTTQQRIPAALNPSPVFTTPTITNEIAFPNPPSIASRVNFSEAYANRLRNPSSTTVIFSTAAAPVFSTSNHKSSALTFRRPANPPVAFPTPTTSSFPSSRSTATAFNFTPATAYANRLRNPSCTTVGFITENQDVFTHPNPTTESRRYQAASWNPEPNESMFSPSTSLPQCIICADKERDIAFEPCGHLSVCSTCVNQIGVLCPICRKVIKKKKKIYIS